MTDKKTKQSHLKPVFAFIPLVLATFSLASVAATMTKNQAGAIWQEEVVQKGCTKISDCPHLNETNIKALPDPNEVAEAAEKKKQVEQAKNTLDDLISSFKFGVGLGFEYYTDDYISETETIGDDRIVRISDSQSFRPSVWLESHYLFGESPWSRRSNWGMYVGLRLLGPDNEVFDGFSVGGMWSYTFRRPGEKPDSEPIVDSINIGVGPVWHRTKELASGITEGVALPSDFNDVKLDTSDEISGMLMISVGF